MKSFIIFDKAQDWLAECDTLEEAEKFCASYANNAPEQTPLHVFRKCAVVRTVTTVKVEYA